ncbi:hypothetical protein TIFTF001_012090 [Ficus carica]|uniref:Uncharacterized protein n=1 Tax=Ficus carica TaxID=3494 RepID=A0AA88A135_FICCA|nr:hypothetical protein TIFTF001_012090 [Ficus carica]
MKCKTEGTGMPLLIYPRKQCKRALDACNQSNTLQRLTENRDGGMVLRIPSVSQRWQKP